MICMGVNYLREEHQLQVFGNKVPSKIFEPKKYELSNLGYYMS
jgi:hypothetical protein